MTEPATATTDDDRPTVPKPVAAQQVPAAAGPDAEASVGAKPRPRVGVLAALALITLAVVLRLADAAITTSSDLDTSLSTAAFVLPLVISVSLVAGISVGLFAVQLLGARLRSLGATIAASSVAGLVMGGATTTAILYTFGANKSVALLATAVGLAGGIGGALGSIRPPEMMAAGAAATLAVFAFGMIKDINHARLLEWFGGKDTVASTYSASGLLAGATAVLSGLVGGLVAYWLLRRWSRRTAHELRWPVYLAAGAVPGGLLLITELIFRIGGAELTGLVSRLSDYDRIVQEWTGSARLSNAIAVLFVGGIAAMIAIGRKLPAKKAD